MNEHLPNYQKMDDRDLEYRLVNHFYGHQDRDINRLWHRGKFNYCSNPSIIMPLAIEHGINLIRSEELSIGYFWQAGNAECNLARDPNPYRAIVISLLKILEGKLCESIKQEKPL